ncbi:hypothetical protein [Flaviaesturariibacter aridisoli]|uniref:Uncharacterized protein n=1 Tax=Flaviaesturariibacter aridisoli TaxID=2545761 RepID=A0A4V6P644_9BACT|nr:hypothetical protein [Flaviaesturariibacter aridisoli]RYY63843.1 MAG: hypothetical protein EOO12_11245 [Chitinophagaceae bacterium]RYZ17180.1 MAG: hypothetical protein EOO16_24605 [Chitinophagaceae bacterium]TCZ65689.1 hypothetical protein E0486_17360 [Flaviaesturariibacter aridisoli]
MMRNLNFFQPGSLYYPFRWFIVVLLSVSGLLAYHDLTGRRLYNFSSNQWNAGGPGTHYHK